MRVTISKASVMSETLAEVERISGENVWTCYQCGCCSAGCPLAFAMDHTPHSIIRLLHLGQEDEVFESNTMWMCASCLTCMTRCPRGVDLSRMLEAIRMIAFKRGKNLERFGPSDVTPELKKGSPPMGMISAFRKFGP